VAHIDRTVGADTYTDVFYGFYAVDLMGVDGLALFQEYTGGSPDKINVNTTLPSPIGEVGATVGIGASVNGVLSTPLGALSSLAFVFNPIEVLSSLPSPIGTIRSSVGKGRSRIVYWQRSGGYAYDTQTIADFEARCFNVDVRIVPNYGEVPDLPASYWNGVNRLVMGALNTSIAYLTHGERLSTIPVPIVVLDRNTPGAYLTIGSGPTDGSSYSSGFTRKTTAENPPAEFASVSFAYSLTNRILPSSEAQFDYYVTTDSTYAGIASADRTVGANVYRDVFFGFHFPADMSADALTLFHAYTGGTFCPRDAIAVLPSPIGSITSRIKVFPVDAAIIQNGIIHYFCTLTGAADGLSDLVFPISSLTVRHRVATDSYYSIVIPSVFYSEAIAARSNGQIVVSMTIGTVTEELFRGALGTVQTSVGPKSQSISVSGNASRAAHTPATYDITNALYTYSTSDGEQRLRIPPRAAIRPGDTVRYGTGYFEVGLVTLTASPKDTTMELAIA
jgi:hypothetical protein